MEHKYKSFIWLVIFCIALSACGDGVVATETPIPVPTTCMLESNIYETPISPDIIALYELGVKVSGNSVEYESVQRTAFNELVNHVYYLSDYVEVPLGEKTARITITNISPELVHYIILNHYLSNRFLDFSDELNEHVQVHTKRFIDRNEHVFFVIFTASVYTVDQTSTFDFPMEKLVLTNRDEAKFIPVHKDPVLKKTIDLTDGPKYGFFYYPMAIVGSGNCKPVLDENYDTNIELSLENIVINDADSGPYSWEYKLASLIDTRSVQATHQERFSMTPQASQFSPEVIELPSWSIDREEFWTALARILWMEVTGS